MTRYANAIKQIADTQAEDVARVMGDSLYWIDKSFVEILGEQERDELTTVWFAFHFMCLDRVQSGSDNYAHIVYGGVATFKGGRKLEVELDEIGRTNPTEWQVEWAPDDKRFDADAAFATARDAWWARVKR